jgi:Flp pilus assembly protein TadD
MIQPQPFLIRAVHAHQTDRLDEARRLYRVALAIEPAQCDGLQLLGLVEKRFDRAAVGVALMRRSLRLTPDFTTVRQNLCRTLQGMGDLAGTLPLLRQLAAERPDDAEILYQLGATLLRQERRREAAGPLRRAAMLRPDHMETRVALSEARVLDPASQGAEFDEALRNARAAVMLDPGNPVAHLQVALVLEEMARATESLTACRRALRLRPAMTDARHIAGINRLRLGDFVGGMADFEARKNNLWFHADGSPIPIWDGRPLPDDTVALVAEGGWGDMIHFVRFVPQVARICGEVVVTCPPRLRRLLSTVPNPAGNIRFNPERAPAIRARSMFLSLPHLLGSTADTVPNCPYLSADPERVRLWTERLSGLGGLRVGLCWSNGDTSRDADPKRSVPFEFVRPLATIPGVSLVNLHKQDNAAKRLADADEALLHRLGADFDSGPDAFLDTAAVMKVLDLVIAIDSSVLHVAGALGVPSWLPAPYRMDWRWMDDAEKSIWYPSLRIYRQDRQWEWSGSMARIARDLARAAEAKAAGLTPDLLPAG